MKKNIEALIDEIFNADWLTLKEKVFLLRSHRAIPRPGIYKDAFLKYDRPNIEKMEWKDLVYLIDPDSPAAVLIGGELKRC
jgi:hypothetical protein